LSHLAIFSGALGSGKTEIALNYALQTAGQYQEVYFADLDMANPYFVARDAVEILSNNEVGITMIAPDRGLAFSDVPNLPPEIVGLLRGEKDMVIDVAGDEAGALVLGYLSKLIQARNNCDMYMVINPYRPFTCRLDEVLDLKYQLEETAKIKFTGVVSNPNLVEETTPDLIREGHRRVVGFAQELDIPVKYLTVEERYYQELYYEYGNYLKGIRLFLRPDWIKDFREGMQDGKGQG